MSGGGSSIKQITYFKPEDYTTNGAVLQMQSVSPGQIYIFTNAGENVLYKDINTVVFEDATAAYRQAQVAFMDPDLPSGEILIALDGGLIFTPLLMWQRRSKLLINDAEK